MELFFFSCPQGFPKLSHIIEWSHSSKWLHWSSINATDLRGGTSWSCQYCFCPDEKMLNVRDFPVIKVERDSVHSLFRKWTVRAKLYIKEHMKGPDIVASNADSVFWRIVRCMSNCFCSVPFICLLKKKRAGELKKGGKKGVLTGWYGQQQRAWTLLGKNFSRWALPKTHCLEKRHQLVTLSNCSYSKQGGLLFPQLVFSLHQARGHQQHNPEPFRNTAETGTKRPAVLKQGTGQAQNDKQWFVFFPFFFLLECYRHSMMLLPGYINKTTPICNAN